MSTGAGLRMIIADNLAIRTVATPVSTGAATAESFTSLRFERGQTRFVSQCDVKNHFFSQLGNSRLARSLLRAGASTVFAPPGAIEQFQCRGGRKHTLENLSVLPMGLSWAMYFAQAVRDEAVSQASLVSPRQVFHFHRPAPLETANSPTILPPYSDNCNVVGISAIKVQETKDSVAAKLRLRGLPLWRMRWACVFHDTRLAEPNCTPFFEIWMIFIRCLWDEMNT